MSGWSDYGFPDNVRGLDPYTGITALVLALRERYHVFDLHPTISSIEWHLPLPVRGGGFMVPASRDTNGTTFDREPYLWRIDRLVRMITDWNTAGRFYVDPGVYDRGICTDADVISFDDTPPDAWVPGNDTIRREGETALLARWSADWALELYRKINSIGAVLFKNIANKTEYTRQTGDFIHAYEITPNTVRLKSMQETFAEIVNGGVTGTTTYFNPYNDPNGMSAGFFTGARFTGSYQYVNNGDSIVDAPEGTVILSTDGSGRRKVLEISFSAVHSTRIDSIRTATFMPETSYFNPVFTNPRFCVHRVTNHDGFWIENGMGVTQRDGSLVELPLTLAGNMGTLGSDLSYGDFVNLYNTYQSTIISGYAGIQFELDYLIDLRDNFEFKAEEE